MTPRVHLHLGKRSQQKIGDMVRHMTKGHVIPSFTNSISGCIYLVRPILEALAGQAAS